MATTVQAGSSSDYTIPAGRTGVFTSTGEGLVRTKAGASGGGFETRRVTAAAEVLMGPFSNDVVVTVIGTSGVTTAKTRRLVPAMVYEDDGVTSVGEAGPAGFSPVSGAGKGLRTVIFGDSLGANNNVALSVSTITLAAGVITVVTSSSHGLRDGQLCNVSGTSNSSFHGRLLPVTWISSTSFSYPAPTGATGTATSGTVLAQNQLSGAGDFVQTNARLGGSMRFIANLGVGGQRADEILARVGEVWPLLPDVLWFNAGTNDNLQDRAYGPTVADIESVVSQAVGRGITVVIKTIPPFASGGALYTAARNANLLNINSFIRRLGTRYRNVYVLDAYAALIQPNDASGYGATAYYQSGDTVHYSARGAARIGVKGAALLASAIPMIDNHVTSVTDNYGSNSANRDLFDSAPWATSGGTINAPAISATWTATTAYAVNATVSVGTRRYIATVAGTTSGAAPSHTSGTATDGTVTWQFVENGATAGLASGWVVDASGTWTVAPTVSTVARADGLGYDVVVTGQPGAAGASFTIRTNASVQNARLPSFVGAKYRWVAEVSVLNAVAAGIRQLVVLSNMAVGSPSGIIASSFVPAGSSGLLNFDSDALTTLLLETPEFVIPSGAVSNSSFSAQVVMDASSSTAVTVKVGSCRMQPMDDQ